MTLSILHVDHYECPSTHDGVDSTHFAVLKVGDFAVLEVPFFNYYSSDLAQDAAAAIGLHLLRKLRDEPAPPETSYH
jgi:hypothetical protein